MNRRTNDTSCYDCAVAVGMPHEGGCDVARCLHTGQQALQCMGEADVAELVEAGEDPNDYDPPVHPGTCWGQIWTGVWPGEEEAIERGWYSKFGSGGWKQCGPDERGALPDLNRVAMELKWDAVQQKMID